MTILILIVAIVILAVAMYYAHITPAPFSYILYGLIVLVVCLLLVWLINMIGGAGVLNRKL